VALVFVHGIGNRSGKGYRGKVAMRDALFRRFLLARALPELEASEIHNPMWGDLGAHLAWDHASLPEVRGGERLGGSGPAWADLFDVVNSDGGDQPLLRAARQRPHDAVDLLYTLVDLRGRDEGEIENLAIAATELADWCDRHDVADKTWLAGIDDDRELVDALVRQIGPVDEPAVGGEMLGGRRRLRVAAHAMLTAAVDRYRQQNIGPPFRHLATATRRLAGRPVSLLIGDVMAYLGGRGTVSEPGPIVSLVASALDDAGRDGPLIVVAHSMGGNISYDVLSHFRPDIEVDTLITVGSQVGLFEELKLFGASVSGVPGPLAPQVPSLPNVGRWINVYDRADVLAYRAAPVFGGAVDYDYPTDAAWAHGAYFRQPTFHARLANKVRKVRS
jgi:hypothetical protein